MRVASHGGFMVGTVFEESFTRFSGVFDESFTKSGGFQGGFEEFQRASGVFQG